MKSKPNGKVVQSPELVNPNPQHPVQPDKLSRALELGPNELMARIEWACRFQPQRLRWARAYYLRLTLGLYEVLERAYAAPKAPTRRAA